MTRRSRPSRPARRPGRATRPRVAGLVGAVVLLLALAGLSAPAVRAAEPTFGTPTIESTFGQGIVLTQPITVDAAPYRVEMLMTSGQDAVPLVVEVPVPPPGEHTMRYTMDVSEGHILPNTPVSVRWRVTPSRGATPITGPAVETVYADDRFDWQTVSGDIVRVHWYEGTRAFAERALAIGEEAVESTSRLLGVTEDDPVDFFIYADQTAFYEALGPGTRENVGGQANADIRTLFALIGPSEIDHPWVGIVVPHELVHLVFDTAVQNPYHFPPRWLNEGLAVYLSQGYDASDRATVDRAARDGELIPLDGLGGQFPTTADGFFLAYAESVSAVDFLIRTRDQDALVALISSYAEGRTDDEAFRDAIGQDLAAFDAAWLADLGAEPPVRHGPRPAPAGPQPSAWTAGGPAGPAAPQGSPEPGTSGGPAATAGASGDGSGVGSAADDDDGPGMPLLLTAVALVVAVIVALVIVRRRRGRPPPAAAPTSLP